MPWAKIDDTLHANRKIRQLWKACPEALGLHLLALSYCAGSLTDGRLDRDLLAQWVPNGRRLQSYCKAIESSGVWIPMADGWQIHDWLDYNASAQEIRAKRAADAARQAAYRDRLSQRDSRVASNASNGAPSHPIPSVKEERTKQERRRSYGGPQGPSHDETNEAGLSWARIKAQRERQDT
jgi:hypothetical protein